MAKSNLAKLNRQEERGLRSRQRILDAASALMAEGSYAGTSISAICARSGLPPTSIYWHFESKEGLLGAVMEEGANRWFASFLHWREPSGEPHEHLEQILDQLADALAREPEFLRLLLMLSLERKRPDPVWLKTIRRLRKKALDRLQALLEMAFASLGEARARQAAAQLSLFALAFADGAFLAHHIDPRTTDLRALFQQLRIALLALGGQLAADAHDRRRARRAKPARALPPEH
jgi:AcrR family transcriptional regulator